MNTASGIQGLFIGRPRSGRVRHELFFKLRHRDIESLFDAQTEAALVKHGEIKYRVIMAVFYDNFACKPLARSAELTAEARPAWNQIPAS